MSDENRQKIIDAAKVQFLSEGFQSASLRKIAEQANCTTGAIYSYFESKDALFHAIVGETHQQLMNAMAVATDGYQHRDERTSLRDLNQSYMNSLLTFGYQHFDEMKLLFLCAAGTRYQHLISELVELDFQQTARYISTRHPERSELFQVMAYEYKVFTRLTFKAMLQPFVDNLSYPRAKVYYQHMITVLMTGWLELELFKEE